MECFGGWRKGEPGEAQGGGGQQGGRAGQGRAGGEAGQGRAGLASNQTKIQFF